MSDLRITSTGKIFYRVDPTLAAILIALMPAAVERVNEDTGIHMPPVAAPPKWFVGTDAGSNPFIGYTFGGQTLRYGGPPDKAVDGFKTRQWNGEKEDYIFDGPEPPASVIEQYRQSYTGEPKSFLPAAYYSAARGSGESK